MNDNKRWPQCFDCGEEFHPKRKELGYQHCLACGDNYAQKAIDKKKKRTAPLYNKGAYQYIGSIEDAKWLGR